ncbi:hypothetical protein [Fischerella thermalis]|uniref:hypothetical protein n=1 Tax=Fischerella thermalis TaxID=372787 RepID=UPI001A00A32E|nr:hypothetical protein [Fischerella thermalis]MBF1990832.1 hypothetical protein [Fischerella thermalis M58_A2018_009]MBF2061274.1 hypothetical protein [Fischerella thermalis M66_A2018_004]
MRTINGKLIIQEIHESENIEKQIMKFSQQQNQQHHQELNNIQNHLSKLDKRCILLEEAISRQFMQFLIINICSVIGLIFLLSWFNSNHQNNQPTKKSTNSTVQELYK